MKVGIYATVEVSDEQRAAIAKKLGVNHATRDDLKQYIWDKGATWADDLPGGINDEEPDFEDLI